MVWICWWVVAMRVAVGQVSGIRRVVRRLWRVMMPGMCHRFQRSVFGFARVRGWCLGRESFWNQRTRVSARATMWSQSRLGAYLANGKRLPPWSLTRAMWVLELPRFFGHFAICYPQGGCELLS